MGQLPTYVACVPIDSDGFTCVKKGMFCKFYQTGRYRSWYIYFTYYYVHLIVTGFLIGAGNLYHKREWATGEILEQISSLRKQ